VARYVLGPLAKLAYRMRAIFILGVGAVTRHARGDGTVLWPDNDLVALSSMVADILVPWM
jgi:hypothetical protein